MIHPDTLLANLNSVRARIAAAAERSGRDPGDIRLLAVTKTEDAGTIDFLVKHGVDSVGENRVPVALKKAGQVTVSPQWHMIGHLQRNKVRKALAVFRYFHSMDSDRLADTLDAESARIGLRVPVLLEVNVAGEESKYGVTLSDAPRLLDYLIEKPHLAVNGFMTMAPYSADQALQRAVFRQLRELAQRERERTGLPLPELSMGMSNDFEIAVEEGATFVRIGSALFVE